MVSAAQLRQQVLKMPQVGEKSHFGQPDFRVRDKIFACLSRDERTATLKLSSASQTSLLLTQPDTFRPAPGRWGVSGWTEFALKSVSQAQLAALLEESRAMVTAKKRGVAAAGPALPVSDSRPKARRAVARTAAHARGRE